ncbi:MAG TPA: PqqD family protein [Gammaproteobacteria bacterium]|nr:PqqD family protein [Gammaproteobacteria bacterium]
MAGSGIPTITERTRVVASRHQLSTKLSGEAVILGLRDSVYYGLDGAGARIWELAQRPASIGEMAAVVSREYAVAADIALNDLLGFAGDLVARGLLEVVPDTAP